MLEVRLQLADLSAVLHGSQLQGRVLLVLLGDLIAELQDLAICLARRRLAGRPNSIQHLGSLRSDLLPAEGIAILPPIEDIVGPGRRVLCLELDAL